MRGGGGLINGGAYIRGRLISCIRKSFPDGLIRNKLTVTKSINR